MGIRQGNAKPTKTVITSPEEFITMLDKEFKVAVADLRDLVVPNTNWPPLFPSQPL